MLSTMNLCLKLNIQLCYRTKLYQIALPLNEKQSEGLTPMYGLSSKEAVCAPYKLYVNSSKCQSNCSACHTHLSGKQ